MSLQVLPECAGTHAQDGVIKGAVEGLGYGPNSGKGPGLGNKPSRAIDRYINSAAWYMKMRQRQVAAPTRPGTRESFQGVIDWCHCRMWL